MSPSGADSASNEAGPEGIGEQRIPAQAVSGLNPKSGKQTANQLRSSAGKNDSRYWLSRLFRPINDRGEVSPHYSMKVQFRGRRMAFTLGTSNKEAAAKKATAIYADLLTIGTEATLVKHRAQKRSVEPAQVTLGDWIAAVGKVFDGKPATFGGYARSLRLIASEILAISKSKRRYGRTEAKVYRRQVDEAPLAILTPEAIQTWRIKTIKRAGENPALQRSARISCNSTIRQARALFSRKITKFIGGTTIPDPVPFAGVEFYPRESMKYQSKLDPSALLQSAEKHLFGPDPEAFKALLLALGAGLRRGEIDRLLWKQVDFTAGLIHVETTIP